MASIATQADIILYAGTTFDTPDTIDPEENVVQLTQSLTTDQLDELWNVEPNLYETIVTEDVFGATAREEPELYTAEEHNILHAYQTLSYEARYMLIRYVLRKHQWVRQSTLTKNYRMEIGDRALELVAELTGMNLVKIEATENEPEIVDLTADPPVAFCLDESHLTLEEALEMLNVDELKALSKEFKLKHTGTRDVLIAALIKCSGNQTVISSFFTAARSPKKGASKLKQTTLDSASTSKTPKKSAQNRMLSRVLHIVGRCMKVKQEVVDLFIKAHLIFFRSTSLPESLLLPALLASFKKRNHPQIEATRSSMLIWPSADIFHAYWKALAVLKQVEEALSYNDPSYKVVTAKNVTSKPFKKGVKEEGEEPEPIPEPRRVIAAKKVWEIVKTVIPEWWEMVQEKKKSTHADAAPRTGLERFEPGYILTRVVHKGADACGILKKYTDEVRILNALLEQTFWRQRKRGCWYDRLALVLTKPWKHIQPGEEIDEELALECLPAFGFQKQVQALRLAFGVVRRSLADERTGRVYIAKLVSRLQKLEHKLKIKEGNCTDVSQYTELEQASEDYIEGVRVYWDTPPPAALDRNGRMTEGSATLMANWVQRSDSTSEVEKRNVPWKGHGKSMWKGRDGKEVNVEEYVIQYYEKNGFKGLHAETRILTTLFGLLFFDILFMPIDGAFETPYQTAPLDLVEDSFYYSRRDEIEARLEEIKNTEAAIERLRQVDEAERERKTWCVGVNWDFCSREDLLEIVHCIGGEVLSTICRLFAEDYASRTSGGPDLIVWDPRMGASRFVEVKGPGDDLMENQKVWIDALLRAGADVQVLHVKEPGTEKRKLIKNKDQKPVRGRKKRKSEPQSSDGEEDTKPIKLDDDDYEPTRAVEHVHDLETGKTIKRRRTSHTPHT